MSTAIDEPRTSRFRGTPLKTTYCNVIGIAITEAMDRVFLRDGQFIGRGLFYSSLPTLLLLLRTCDGSGFVHGHHITLLGGWDAQTEAARRFLWILSFQALLFFFLRWRGAFD